VSIAVITEALADVDPAEIAPVDRVTFDAARATVAIDAITRGGWQPPVCVEDRPGEWTASTTAFRHPQPLYAVAGSRAEVLVELAARCERRP
jgi:hypothetical protein